MAHLAHRGKPLLVFAAPVYTVLGTHFFAVGTILFPEQDVFGPMSSAVSVRSALRDSLNRLRSIRQRCGKNDDGEDGAEVNTGDPFRDKTTKFARSMKKLKDLIVERNEGVRKNGNDTVSIEQSHEITKTLRELEKDLTDVKAFVDQADQQLAKANKKKKSASTIQLLERQLKDRQSGYTTLVEMLEAAKNMASDRGDKGKLGGNKPNAQLGNKLRIREQLSSLKAADPQAKSEGGGSSAKPEDDPATAEQMKQLAEQEKKINRGLDQVGKVVGRLKDLAYQIGTELDVQNKMLDQTEEKVDSQTKQLKMLNRRLGKMIKETKPANMCTNVGCVVLLVALVGYFLYQFGVV